MHSRTSVVPMTDRVCVGAIAGAFGVRGEVRLKSFCARPEDIAKYAPLSSEQGAKTFKLKISRSVKNGFAARLTGVDTKEQADALRGTRLYVDRSQLPALPDNEYYHADLMGLEVYDTGGTALGKVKSVQNHGASDLLEIHGASLKSTVLLPFTIDSVPTVDLKSGRIVVDPPEGIF